MINKIKFVIYICFAIFLVSCGATTPEFFTTEGGLKYKYHEIGDGATPKAGDYLVVDMQFKTASDSVYYDSRSMNVKGFDVIMLGSTNLKGGIEEGFAKLKMGDSVSFYIMASKFYKYYQKTSVPPFMEKKEEMKITLRLRDIQKKEDYELDLENALVNAEFDELIAIDAEIEKWRATGDSVYEFDGVFVQYLSECTTERITYGDPTWVRFVGHYIDGAEFYNNLKDENPAEFKVGVSGQNIEGMKIALLHMCEGQSARVLVPSMLGFSETAIKQGMIKAFEPLLFDIEVVPYEGE
jgi:FKBP-type peptidyl-prolyl cis-trans isomerase FkpA